MDRPNRLDVLAGANENLHSPAVWAFLWMLAKEGKLRVLYGGPPCRSTSRLYAIVVQDPNHFEAEDREDSP